MFLNLIFISYVYNLKWGNLFKGKYLQMRKSDQYFALSELRLKAC